MTRPAATPDQGMSTDFSISHVVHEIHATTERKWKQLLLDSCKKSKDELFHYTLYQWYPSTPSSILQCDRYFVCYSSHAILRWLDQELDAELLNINTEYVEKFLRYLAFYLYERLYPPPSLPFFPPLLTLKQLVQTRIEGF